MNKYLDIAPEVAEALAAGKPVVALESTIISHGMPYPQNVETALKVESIIREAGAVPATIAIIGGRLKAGLSKEEIDYLGRTGAGIPKASRRDLPVLVAQGRDGACTVTTTMMIADMAGIRVFATGGIGGVHRGAQETFDISADLEELANTSVMVVCAGAKSILDLGLTLEYLETHGVTVIGYGTSELPAFYTRKSGFGVDYELDTPEQLAKAFHVKRELGLRGGLLVTNPIPEEYSMDKEVIDKAIAEAVEDAKKDGIHGKATTPYLLAKIKDLTGGKCTAQSGTIWYDSCLPQIENADLLAPAETAPAMIMQLQTGTVDFVCTDMPTAKAAAARDDNLVILDFSGTDGDFQYPSEEKRAEEVNIGIAVRKGNTTLKDAINSVLETMTPDDFNALMDQAIAIQPEV